MGISSIARSSRTEQQAVIRTAGIDAARDGMTATTWDDKLRRERLGRRQYRRGVEDECRSLTHFSRPAAVRASASRSLLLPRSEGYSRRDDSQIAARSIPLGANGIRMGEASGANAAAGRANACSRGCATSSKS